MIPEQSIKGLNALKEVNRILTSHQLNTHDVCSVTGTIFLDAYAQLHNEDVASAHFMLEKIFFILSQIEGEKLGL